MKWFYLLILVLPVLFTGCGGSSGSSSRDWQISMRFSAFDSNGSFIHARNPKLLIEYESSTSSFSETELALPLQTTTLPMVGNIKFQMGVPNHIDQNSIRSAFAVSVFEDINGNNLKDSTERFWVWRNSYNCPMGLFYTPSNPPDSRWEAYYILGNQLYKDSNAKDGDYHIDCAF